MTNNNGSTDIIAKQAAIIVKALLPIFLAREGSYFNLGFEDDFIFINILNLIF